MKVIAEMPVRVYPLILLVAFHPGAIQALDIDDDSVADNADNCMLVPNPAQRDTDNDGYGNYCDPDFNGDLLINASDMSYLKSKFFTNYPDGDLNGDGVVNAGDLSILKSFFFRSPGPSATASGAFIQIVTPDDGAAVDGYAVNVHGIFTGDVNSGIMVNGTTACAYNNNFYVNNLPIVPGENTLSATYTAQDGSTKDTSVTVTRSGSTEYKFIADKNCGVVPLKVNFDFDVGGNAVQQLDIDFDADGTIDLTTTEPVSALLEYSYSTPGVYPVTAWVTSGSVVQQLSLNIVVNDEVQLDDKLQAVWDGMWTALKAGDRTTAVQYLTPSAARAYGGIFDSLMPYMAETYEELSVLERVDLNSDTADYAVIRLENGVIRTFLINYKKENDGVWRIDSM